MRQMWTGGDAGQAKGDGGLEDPCTVVCIASSNYAMHTTLSQNMLPLADEGRDFPTKMGRGSLLFKT